MEFIIMGCDGIWDCVDIQKFCEFRSVKIKR
jgi:serine/threonine protein phosphatase PrpC